MQERMGQRAASDIRQLGSAPAGHSPGLSSCTSLCSAPPSAAIRPPLLQGAVVAAGEARALSLPFAHPDLQRHGSSSSGSKARNDLGSGGGGQGSSGGGGGGKEGGKEGAAPPLGLSRGRNMSGGLGPLPTIPVLSEA